MQFTKEFKDLSSKDVEIAGGKGASLGEMTQAGIPVPEGYVVLSDAFEQFINENNLNATIDAELDKINHEDVNSIEKASKMIQDTILRTEILPDIANSIKEEFKKLNTDFVAVRSSATSEDSADAAWAGQLDSFLNTTEKTLIENVRKCWASLFTPRAIFYRFEKKLHKEKVSVAVVVQKMVNSEESGIAFSVHPVTEDRNHIIIEAGFGLGEAIVSGQITPDAYVTDKQDSHIIDINVSEQSRGLYRLAKGGNEWKELGEKGEEQVLTKKEILELSKIIINIENHYRFPVDIEWAKEKGKFYIVQSRPITTLMKEEDKKHFYTKAFARDYSLAMLEVWYKGEAHDKKPYSMETQPSNPYIIFERGDNTVKSYYDDKGVEWITTHLLDQLKNKTFLKELEKNTNEKLKKIKPIYEAGEAISKKKLLQFINDFQIAYPWVEAMWMLCHMYDDGTLKENIDNILKLRNQTEKLAGGTDIVTRKSLAKIFPKLKDYIHVLSLNEIKSENLPSIKELKIRDKGFIFTDNELFINESMEDIEKKYDINFKRAIDEITGDIKGDIARKGFAKGKVKRLMGYKQIKEVQEGDIIVSPMTMPDFLPAIKKAAAIITDEGGIISHAAIISRELKTPCIIGTKVATDILKDGDLVEVDADKGIVKIIKKPKEPYVFHTSVSEFPLLMSELIFNNNTYGEVDYVMLYEKDISLWYLTEKGNNEAYELSKKLIDNNFFAKLFNESEKMNDFLKTYEGAPLNEKNIIKEWKSYVKLFHQFSKIYRFYEPPFQQAIEELVLKEISEKEIREYLVNHDQKIIENLNKEGKEAFEKLLKLADMKLILHEKSAKFVSEHLMSFIEFVAKKNNISAEVISSLREKEFVDAIKGKPINISIAKERMKGCALVKRNDRWHFDSGNKYLDLKEKIKKTQNKDISGNTAFPGKVKGKVVLHQSWTDTTELDEGDILVTGMTNPQMIPFIKKAGAIVTDEGGIICHAAIISREMKKPCITGTKNATQLLKDGDFVEVDADKGIVRIIK